VTTYVDAIVDVQLKVGFTGSGQCWDDGAISPANCDPQYNLAAIGQTDTKGRFNLTWIRSLKRQIAMQ